MPPKKLKFFIGNYLQPKATISIPWLFDPTRHRLQLSGDRRYCLPRKLETKAFDFVRLLTILCHKSLLNNDLRENAENSMSLAREQIVVTFTICVSYFATFGRFPDHGVLLSLPPTRLKPQDRS
jgi:hypothetical protein